MSRLELSHDELLAADRLISLAIAEDFGDGVDLTAMATIPAGGLGSARFTARKPGIVAGLAVAGRLAETMGLGAGWTVIVEDGAVVAPGTVVAEIHGSMRTILGFERTALNFLQHLSGVATLTGRFVEAVQGTRAVILDTRKTLPGWRLLDKFAVRCGGGHSHRIGLYDAILIKDNHLAWLIQELDPIAHAVAAGRASVPNGTVVEVEVDSLEQLDRALACRPDIILVDNFDASGLREAVRRRNAVNLSILLEASGGVNLDTVRGLAETGVDRISVGALTHSAPALDIGLDFAEVLLA